MDPCEEFILSVDTRTSKLDESLDIVALTSIKNNILKQLSYEDIKKYFKSQGRIKSKNFFVWGEIDYKYVFLAIKF